jgi:hypothetical protein
MDLSDFVATTLPRVSRATMTTTDLGLGIIAAEH